MYISCSFYEIGHGSFVFAYVINITFISLGSNQVKPPFSSDLRLTCNRIVHTHQTPGNIFADTTNKKDMNANV